MKNKIFIYEYDFFYNKKLINFLLIILPLVIGVTYILLQWFLIGEIKDSIFIGILIGANALLLRGILMISNYVCKNCINFFVFTFPNKKPNELEKESFHILRRIFNIKNMSIAGFIYGTVVGLAPFVFRIMDKNILLSLEGNTILLVFLSIFLFLINFVTGIFFYSLLMFFLISIEWGRLVRVELWSRENISMDFLRNMKFKIIIIGTIYIVLCMISIIFSILPKNILIFGYATFSIITMLAIFIVPEIPVRRKLILEKKEAVDKINTQIQLEYNKLFHSSENSLKLDLRKIDQLIQFKEKIESLSTWPGSFKIIRTTIGIIIISILPVGIQILLEQSVFSF